jgi:hypothetical protein
MRGSSTSWIEFKKASAAAVLLLALAAGCEGAGMEPNPVEEVSAPLSATSALGYLRTESATGPFVLDPFYTANSSQVAPNQVTHLGTGAYQVDFPGLGYEGGGNVQVTAIGTTGEKCKIGTWFPYLGTQRVYVLCFGSNGAPANSRFTVIYHRRSNLPGVQGGYVFADQPTTWTYTPSLGTQWNSTGAAITISHGNSTGYYMVRFPGQSFSGGTVQVTAVGWGAEHCKVVEWRDIGVADQQAVVACFDNSGRGVDTLFSAVLSKGSPFNTPSYGYVVADEPTNPSYISYLAATRVYANGVRGPVSITRSGVGRYTVYFQGLGGASKEPTSVKVTGYGPTADACKLVGWAFRSASVDVACFNPAGAPVDTKFTATFLQPFVPSFPF